MKKTTKKFAAEGQTFDSAWKKPVLNLPAEMIQIGREKGIGLNVWGDIEDHDSFKPALINHDP